MILTFLRILAWFYFIQPKVGKKILGKALSQIFYGLKIRSHIIQQNLSLAYPGDSQEAIAIRKKLFRAAYLHLGNLVFEVLLVLGPMRRFVTKYSEICGIEHWREAKKKGKGIIFLTSHVGNWEIMAASGGIAGMDLCMITKRLQPGWFHQAIENGRKKSSVGGIYEPRTFKEAISHLRKNGTIGIVMDQYAGAPVGVRVPVFGVPVGTPSMVAALAKRTGAVVLPVVNYRTPHGRHINEIRQSLEWQSDSHPIQELALNTALYASVVEKDIYAHPEQWLWIHRRFKGDLSPLRKGEWQSGRMRR